MISPRALQWQDTEKPRLLLVDNQAEHIEPLYRIFRRTAQLFLAHRAEQTLSMCDQHQPDVVIVNLNAAAPMNGLQICRELSAAHPDIKLLALTTQGQRQQEILALKAGVADCISSPLNPMMVRARVETQLLLKSQTAWLRDWVDASPVAEALHQKRFETQLKTEWQRSVRNGQALTVLAVSLDRFEHLISPSQADDGGDAMNALGRCLRQQLKRPADVVCRDGAQGFACVLPDTPWPASLGLARQLAARTRGLSVASPDFQTPWALTISIGVATRTRDSQGSMDSLLALAKARLLEAQEAGGGQVRGVLLP